jgi:hypothetical protein
MTQAALIAARNHRFALAQTRSMGWRAGHRGKVNDGHRNSTIGRKDDSGLLSCCFIRTRTVDFHIRYITFMRDEQITATAINKREENSQAWEALGKSENATTSGN